MMNCASARFFSTVFRVSHKVPFEPNESICTEEGRLRTIGVALSFKANARSGRPMEAVSVQDCSRLIRYIASTMRRMHRLAGLFSALSLVASVVVTSGFACQLPGGADQMAGMSMPNAADAPSTLAGTGYPTGEAPAPDPAPCGLPSAPTACQSMVACAPIAVASQRVGIAARSGAVVRVASAAVLTPSSETIAPELPPPRA